MTATHGMWECEHGVDGRDLCDQCHAPAPLDLDAIRARAEKLTNEWSSKYAFDLLAEVERLRAESVPRSALVQVGWRCEDGRLYGFRCCDWAEPVYIIREDTDA